MNTNTILNSLTTPFLEEDEEIVYTITPGMLTNTIQTNTVINPINTVYSTNTNTNGIGFPWSMQEVKSKVQITSEDIFIDGQGLSERLGKIEKRLDILVVNPALEQKYEQLKKLGEEYRQLEKELLEKDKVLDILKR